MKSHAAAVVLVAMWSLPPSGFAQTRGEPAAGADEQSTSTVTDPFDASRVSTLLPDLARDLVHLPSRRTVRWLAAASAASLAAVLLDDELKSDPGKEWGEPSEVFDPGTYLGNGATLAAGAALAYGVGRWTHRAGLARAASDVLRAQALGHVMAQSLKHAVRRERPDLSGNTAFPSGHADASFATAAALQPHLSRRWKVVAYAVATYVAMSRMHENRHHLSDVVFGSGIGLISGLTTTRDTKRRPTVTPVALRNGVGVVVSR